LHRQPRADPSGCERGGVGANQIKIGQRGSETKLGKDLARIDWEAEEETEGECADSG